MNHQEGQLVVRAPAAAAASLTTAPFPSIYTKRTMGHMLLLHQLQSTPDGASFHWKDDPMDPP
jgi:hypothetical protein